MKRTCSTLSVAGRLFSLSFLAFALGLLSSSSALAQIPVSTPPPPPPPGAAPEVSVQETVPTFHLRVNLVQVRVVVRDSAGKPVDNLTQADFLLRDQGKLQQISTFAVETRASRIQKALASTAASPEAAAIERGSTILPDRFIALVYDDSHISLEDATYARLQTMKFVDTITPTDRVAVFTTSGQLYHSFTSDTQSIKDTITGLVPRPKYIRQYRECPDISAYEADQIQNQANPQVYDTVVEETLQCAFGGDRNKIGAARAMVSATAPKILYEENTESDYVYSYLEDVVRRMAGMPGERIVIFVSPGFLLTTQLPQMIRVVERANHANVVVNSMDVRGLYSSAVQGELSRANSDTVRTVGYKTTYRVASQAQEAYVLSDFANGTGGAFFHNSNDLAAGLQRLGSAPEVAYVLGFSPTSQKMDGNFHPLQVSLTGKRKFSIQARSGYYAPRQYRDPQEQLHDEMQEAVFSRDEIQDLPMVLQTEFSRLNAADFRLNIISKLQLTGVHFRKANGRNEDSFIVATVVFDENGNFVVGGQKVLDMHLQDTTYAKLMQGGLTVKASFDLHPGKYLIRQVVRDSEGSQMAARNGAVDIPD